MIILRYDVVTLSRVPEVPFAVYIQECASELMVVQDAEASRRETRKAVCKQRLRDDADAKYAKGSPSPLFPSHLPEVALDLHVVFGAADDVPSGEEPMGDDPADAASASPPCEDEKRAKGSSICPAPCRELLYM